MAPRLELQTLLEELLGSEHVYFQPPPDLQMAYPCIVYKRDNARTKFADNQPYSYEQRYMVTAIDRNPDSDIYKKLSQLPKCVYNRWFAANSLNHDVFTLYY